MHWTGDQMWTYRGRYHRGDTGKIIRYLKRWQLLAYIQLQIPSTQSDALPYQEKNKSELFPVEADNSIQETCKGIHAWEQNIPV